MKRSSAALLGLSTLIVVLTARQPAEAAASCYALNCSSCSPGGGSANVSTLIPASAFPANPEGNTPIAFVDPDDGRGHRFVVTQQGRIYVWTGWRIRPEPFLDLSARVLYGGERGLLAMAVAPDYASSRRFYVYYTGEGSAPGNDGDIVIERYQRSPSDPETASPTPTTVLVLSHTAAGNHNGGWLAFGPNDGYLYVSTGDGGGGCDSVGMNGQNRNTLLGKILRLDVSGVGPTPADCGNDYFATTGYVIPANNPLVGTGECDEIWAYGLRNPFRFSFDRQTGDLFVGDVGQDNWEEINFMAADASPLPFNFGWVTREGCDSSRVSPSCCGGMPCSNPSPSCQYPTGSGLHDPILCHSNPSGWAAIMGGYRYRGTFVPTLAGRYLYSDTACGQIWRTTFFDSANPITAQAECWDAGNNGMYGFAEDHLGELYVVNGGGGRVDCIHGGAGCAWAAEPLVFGDDFETGNDDRWGWTAPP